MLYFLNGLDQILVLEISIIDFGEVFMRKKKRYLVSQLYRALDSTCNEEKVGIALYWQRDNLGLT
jgi:hypothetical protein